MLEVGLGSQHHSQPMVDIYIKSPDGCAISICFLWYQHHSESLYHHSVTGCILIACYDIEIMHHSFVVIRGFVKQHELDGIIRRLHLSTTLQLFLLNTHEIQVNVSHRLPLPHWKNILAFLSTCQYFLLLDFWLDWSKAAKFHLSDVVVNIEIGLLNS